MLAVDHRFSLSNPALLSAPSKKSLSRASRPILECNIVKPSTGSAGRVKLRKTLTTHAAAVVRGTADNRPNAFVNPVTGLRTQAKDAAHGLFMEKTSIAVAYLRLS